MSFKLPATHKGRMPVCIWYKNNNISMDGLIEKDDKTPQLFSILKMEKEKKRHVMVLSIIKK